MIPLKELLHPALQRARVSTQVSAAQIVVCVDAYIAELLEERKKDARALSFRDGVLTIETRHASMSQHLFEKEDEIRQCLKDRFPAHQIRKIRFHVVRRFKRSEYT